MTEMLHSQEAPVALTTLVSTPHPEASSAERPMRVPREQHVLRLYEELNEHGGFTARVRPGALVIARDGYAVAIGADLVQLPADTTFAMFSYAVDMLLAQHPRMRAIRAREHEGHIDLEPVEVYDSQGAAQNTGHHGTRERSTVRCGRS